MKYITKIIINKKEVNEVFIFLNTREINKATPNKERTDCTEQNPDSY